MMGQGKKALVTWITGQDGCYLAEFLLGKDYEVHGLVRRSSTFNTRRINHLYVDPHETGARFFLHYGDLSDSEQLTHLIYNLQPDEIYHGRPEPCAGQLRHARIHWGYYRPGRNPTPGGYSPQWHQDPVLPGLLQRTVWLFPAAPE